MKRILLYSFASLIFLFLQTVLGQALSIQHVVPDFLLLWIVYLALREGQVASTTAGFLLGLGIDLLSGHDGMLGAAAFSKTVAGFFAGYFYNENKMLQILGGYQLIVLIAVASALHNAVYFLILLQGSGIGWWAAIFRYGIPTTAYTTVFGLIPMFGFARKYLS